MIYCKKINMLLYYVIRFSLRGKRGPLKSYKINFVFVNKKRKGEEKLSLTDDRDNTATL